jgi:hypothetical protein
MRGDLNMEKEIGYEGYLAWQEEQEEVFCDE